MLQIKFFSLVREALDVEHMELAVPAGVVSVDGLKHWLAEQHGELWRETLFQPNLVQAVNQKVVDPDAPVVDGDEVAFFPPMTGG